MTGVAPNDILDAGQKGAGITPLPHTRERGERMSRIIRTEIGQQDAGGKWQWSELHTTTWEEFAKVNGGEVARDAARCFADGPQTMNYGAHGMYRFTAMKITEARPLGTYGPPQWLVNVQGPPMGGEAIGFLDGGEIEVLSTSIRGWDGCNAILRLHMDELEWDFLVKLEAN